MPSDKPTPKPQVRPSEFVTRNEAAAMLHVCLSTIDALRQDDEKEPSLPWVNIRSKVVIFRSAVEKILREGAASCN
jgi:hypothetical protein